MPNGYWTRERIQDKANKHIRRVDFIKSDYAAYRAAKKQGVEFLNTICFHMAAPLTAKYSDEELICAAKLYNRRGDFKSLSPKEYGASCNRGKDFLNLICNHMDASLTEAYSDEELIEKAKKYSRRSDFSKNDSGAYIATHKRGSIFFENACSHMEASLTESYSTEELYGIAKLHNRRVDFEKNNPGAYAASCKHKEYESMCSHMDDPITEAYTFEEVRDIALSCNSYHEFKKKSNGAYKAAKRMGVLNEIRSHMEQLHGTSIPEKEMLSSVLLIHPTAKKIKDMTVKIESKPYIRGFDIDIFVPELNKGIEFDGTYHHSFKCMRKNKNKKHWSDEDIRNYHEIKDAWFLSKGIQILHIKEEDWIKDKEECIKRCLGFLSK